MIVIVAGMHRSGTSALAGLLHNNGISMGRDEDFYPPPMRENPAGFYENVRFRRYNDKMLAEHKYRVKSWNVHPPLYYMCSEKTVAGMIDLIRDYRVNDSHWGWKDPRTSLTIKVWLRLLRALELKHLVRIIQCTRPAADVASSMRQRNNQEHESGSFEQLTRAYHDRLSGGVFGCGYSDQLLTVRFEDLLHDTATTIAKVSDFIEVPLDDISHIDQRLERSTDGGNSRTATDREAH